MVTLPLVGGCQCGGLRYEISQPPLMIYNCHCTNCQERPRLFRSAAVGALYFLRSQESVTGTLWIASRSRQFDEIAPD